MQPYNSSTVHTENREGLHNLERIGDYCANIANYVLEHTK
ncbi:MAG: PhoU domain-containing protein [Peptococcaceae bacterium]|nr:PhoU domain-containing protein [Peptococcaceae bacterium]